MPTTHETRRFHRAATVALTVVCIGAPVPGAAQDHGPVRHAVVLDIGVRSAGIDDALASPARYTAVAPLLGAAYAYRSPAWQVGVSGTWSAPRLEPADTDDPETFEDAQSVALDAWAARRVWRSGSRWAAYVGPGIAVDVGLRRHQLGDGTQQRYDNGFVGLEVAGLLEWSPAWGGRFSGQVMVPVVGLAARTSYTGLASEGPEVTVGLPPTFLLLRHRLAYTHPVSDRFALSVHHEGSFLRHTEPLALAVAWQRLGVGLQLRWGRP